VCRFPGEKSPDAALAWQFEHTEASTAALAWFIGIVRLSVVAVT
jgi:hypothetical protein